MDVGAAFDLLRQGFGALAAAIGVAAALVGAIGVLRFPDFYTRLHAGIAETYGAALALFGLACAAPDWGVAARLLVLSAFIAAMAPALAHLMGHAAHAGGLAPLAGAYRAPRPGAKREGKAQ